MKRIAKAGNQKTFLFPFGFRAALKGKRKVLT
jgi:hypothetical protein